MRETARWSLNRRIRGHVLAVIALMSLTVTVSVGIHYGSDVPELHRRSVLNLATRMTKDLPAAIASGDLRAYLTDRYPIFSKYPDAYSWVVMDDADGFVATSSRQTIARSEVPTIPTDHWSARSELGGWVGGVSATVGDREWHVAVAAHSDPGGLLIDILKTEVAMHILLPLVPFSILVMVVTSAAVTRTLRPLRSLSSQASRVGELNDIRPLDPADAPVEIVQLVDALNTALTKLAAGIERERDFLLDASHALRTPLAAVQARLEVDGSTLDPLRLKKDVDALVRLTTQLLASANAERLVVDAASQADLSAIASEVVSDMTPLAIRAGIDLGLIAEAEPGLVRGDRDAISHALRNIVENALKHTPKSGNVTVRVASHPPSLSVIDDGPGVPLDRREVIFTRFARNRFGDDTGAGLGLSIVQRIITAHGGNVEIGDAPTGGAMVSMNFPAAR